MFPGTGGPLLQRIRDEQVREVILAFDSDVESDATIQLPA
jgi:recombinational DNA repair protein RecR